MTNEQILTKAIEKAVKNGFDDGGGFIFDFATHHNCPESFIFSHDFAKAFWGGIKVKRSKEIDSEMKELFIGEEWQYQLSKMVLEKEPLKYIEKFL